MKLFKTVSVFVLAIFCLTMVSGSFAADCPVYGELGTKCINVKVNKEFTIVLDSNPTTGNKWMAGYDYRDLKLKTNKYVTDYSTAIGAGGHQIFVFKALKVGDTEITMNYNQPWSNCIGKVDRYKVHVTK